MQFELFKKFASPGRSDGLWRKKHAQDNITKDLKDLEPLEDKWRAFGWDTYRINGHDMGEIINTLKLPVHDEKPRMIIADTIKGKGVSFMEGKTSWHGVAPNEDDLNKALKELEDLKL